MEALKDGLLLRGTPGQSAIVYGVAGLIVGMLMSSRGTQ